MTTVWLNWVAFEDFEVNGQAVACSCWCGEHHAKGIVRPSRCDGCGRRFTSAAIVRTVRR